MTDSFLHADDQNKTSSTDDNKTVPMGSNGASSQVQKQPTSPKKIFGSALPSDNYDPSAYDLNRSSTMANKQFMSGDAAIVKNNSSFQGQQQRTFITKSYFGNASFQGDTSTPNLATKVTSPSFNSYDHAASGFDKSFNTSAANAGQDKTAPLTSATSADQGRTAMVGGRKIETFASTSITPKPYLGPGSAQARQDALNVNEGLSRVSNLPNRPLTIDEVRELINHDTKPDTDSKPAPPSKPLNDPDYKRVPSPALPVDDDKSDMVPSPGTMAEPQPPENSEPLPVK